MAKRKNNAGKKGGSGCGGLLILLVLAAIFGRPGQQGSTPRSTATLRATSTIRSQALISQPRNTLAPTRTPAPTRTAVPTRTPVDQVQITSVSVAQRDLASPVSTTSNQNVSAKAVTNATRTSQPTNAIQPTRTPVTRAEEYTATGNANVRSCPKTTCDIVRGVSLGERLTKVSETQGDSVNGSSLWYEIRLATGATGFIHSGLARAGTPRPAPVVQQPRATTAPNQAAPTIVDNTQPNVLPTVPQSTAAPSSQFTCGGDFYNCSDFRNRTELMAYFNACAGDPSRLDADNDGIPCESLR